MPKYTSGIARQSRPAPQSGLQCLKSRRSDRLRSSDSDRGCQVRNKISSPHERSDMRESDREPGYRYAHPGYKSAYNGKLSCFFAGVSTFLSFSIDSARAIRLRVECGMMTSSM